MLIQTPSRLLKREIDEATRVYRLILRSQEANTASLSRRAVLRGAVAASAAVGVLSYFPSRAEASPLPMLLFSAGARKLIASQALKLLGRGAMLFGTWWLGEKLEQWLEAASGAMESGHYEGGVGDSTRWIGPTQIPWFPVKPPPGRGSGEVSTTAEIEKRSFRKILQNAIETWTQVVGGGGPTNSGVISQPEGTALLVSPRSDNKARVFCARDIDAKYFMVPLGVMPSYVGRNSNWVQVLHPDWRRVASEGAERAPTLGYQFMDARDLSWAEGDTEMARLHVYPSSEESDGQSPGCKPASLVDMTCKDF